MTWIRDHISELAPLCALFIVLLIYLVVDLLDFQKFLISDAIVLVFLATISWYIVSMSFKNETSFEKINETLDKNIKDSERFKAEFEDIGIQFENQGTATGLLGDKINQNDNKLSISIKEIDTQLKDLKKETSATVRELDSQAEFYRVLNDKVLSAKSRVWLMHLDPYAPDSNIYADLARTEYFKNCAEKAIAQNTAQHPVEFRRIINIPTLGKLEWAEKLINETKDLKNLHLAYIHIDDIEDSFPISVTSCQIIDNRAVFLLNPELNVVPEGKFKTCIIIENEKIVSVYKNYYEKIWNLLEEKNSKKGCIIKDGPGTSLFNKNKQRILDDINEGSMEHKEGVIKA